MNRNERLTVASTIASDAKRLGDDIEGAVDRLSEWRVGASTSTYGGERGGSGRYDVDEKGDLIPVAAPTDPTGESGIAGRDRFDLIADRLDSELRRAAAAMHGLMFVLGQLQTNTEPLAECERHRQCGVFRPVLTVVVVRRRGVPLCRWCRDIHRKTKRLPTDAEVTANIEGRHVRVRTKA